MNRMHESTCSAVTISSGFKTFCPGKKDETRVLSDFSMSVYPGVLYSLLGSSGCGKSTILSCILGLEKLDRGTVSVFGHKHFPMQRMECTQSIGYMPQEVSLYNSLSISETLMYFGTIFSPSYAEGIDKSYLKERSRLLARLLYLPQLSRIVATLSGGQRRRLSFAAALIHEPDLLLLDEPTVGIDPLIRKCMWEYLRTLINTKGTTVIFTTHYIEEANSSDVIGIIKDGRLIAEQSPASLLESHGVHSLEAVYLQLSKLQNTSQTPTESSPIPHEAEGSSLTNRAHWIYKTAVKRIGSMVQKNYR